MQTINFATSIQAPARTVWDIMTSPDTYQEWVGAAFPGSRFRGEWKEGTDLQFVDDTGAGTLARLHRIEPFRLAEAEHIAMLEPGGTVDTESEQARNWMGTRENYYLEEKEGVTHLRVEMHTLPEYAGMFEDNFPIMLDKLKEMSERQATPA